METTEWKTSCRIGKKGENAAKILMEQFNVPYQDKSKDKVFQRMDVDFLLTHPNREWQFLEAKARARDYGDIGLELVTNDTKNTIGWAYNSKCHLLTYYIDSSRKMYVCDGPRQREWLNNIDTARAEQLKPRTIATASCIPILSCSPYRYQKRKRPDGSYQSGI